MKRLTIILCLLWPFAAAAQVNLSLFDTGFHASTAIGQLEEMSGQSVSTSSYNSYYNSGTTHHYSGTTGADAIKDAKSKFKKPSARPQKFRPPRPSKAQKEYARKLKKWNDRSKKKREQAVSVQRYARTRKMVTTDTNVSKGKDIVNTKKARKKAWNLKAKIKRKISKEVRKNLGM